MYTFFLYLCLININAYFPISKIFLISLLRIKFRIFLDIISYLVEFFKQFYHKH